MSKIRLSNQTISYRQSGRSPGEVGDRAIGLRVSAPDVRALGSLGVFACRPGYAGVGVPWPMADLVPWSDVLRWLEGQD